MSLHPEPLAAVPEETARVARAAFPQGNRYMRLRDQIGVFMKTKPLPPCSRLAGNPPKPRGG